MYPASASLIEPEAQPAKRGDRLAAELDGRGGTDGSVSLSQLAFIRTILKCFGMEKAHQAQTPLDTHVKLDEIGGNKTPLYDKDMKLYQAIFGSLMYAALAT